MSATLGSSPLARGLLLVIMVVSILGGIIPARAGFTRRASPLGWCATDHPRSRGVYLDATSAAWAADGSSPLARGLRCPWHPQLRDDGIIPARAGFTPRPVGHGRGHLDHPRSRGVYGVWSSICRCWNGSSPLARGLQVGGDLPANARLDHPRSRGVYSDGTWTAQMHQGSSPLARGLPPLVDRGSFRGGIIPARAGFTRRRLPPRGRRPDHPRSRGVYYTSVSTGSVCVGSSPLARGLRARPHQPRRPRGIIPARAGFTGWRGDRPGCRPDHPRSRGVYVGGGRGVYPAR